MTIILGILVPAILFLVTLPLQSFLFVARQHLKVEEKKEKSTGKGSLSQNLGFSNSSNKLRSRLGLSAKKQSKSKVPNKFKVLGLKAMQKVVRGMSFLVSFLRTLASSMICVSLSAVMILIPTVVAVVAATAGIVMFLNSDGTTTYNPSNNTSISDSSSDFSGEVSDVRYLQSNFPQSISSSATIAGEGCGWCSLTHMMVNLNPEKCGNMTPADWLSVMPSEVKNLWGSSGMIWTAPQKWVDALNSIGTYGEYKLVYKIEDSNDRTSDIIKTAKEYMHEKNTVMVLSSSTGLFTGGGHIILLTSIASDDSYFTITDSSNKAYNYLLQGGESVTSETMNSFQFPTNVTSLYNQPYNFKCCWVIKRIS